MKEKTQRVRVGVRRFQLTVGVGFLSFVVGALLSSELSARGLPPSRQSTAAAVLSLLNARLWVVTVLPLFFYLLARVVALRKLSTALIGALSGELFLCALQGASGGWEALYSGPLAFVVRGVTFAAGVALTYAGIGRARQSAARTDAATRVAAEARSSEYAELLAESVRLAERHEAATALPRPVPEPERTEASGEENPVSPKSSEDPPTSSG